MWVTRERFLTTRVTFSSRLASDWWLQKGFAMLHPTIGDEIRFGSWKTKTKYYWHVAWPHLLVWVTREWFLPARATFSSRLVSDWWLQKGSAMPYPTIGDAIWSRSWKRKTKYYWHVAWPHILVWASREWLLPAGATFSSSLASNSIWM